MEAVVSPQPKVVGHQVYVAQHDQNYEQSFWKVRKKLDEPGRDPWAYWKVRPTHTAANIE